MKTTNLFGEVVDVVFTEKKPLQTKEERKERAKKYRQANREKIAKRNKKYRQANREKIAKRHKKYQQANREKIRKQKKKYQQANREKLRKYNKKYWWANREKKKKYDKKYRQANKEKVRKRKKKYEERPENKFRKYKKSAVRRSLSFDLTEEEFFSFWQKPCHYCGEKIEALGLDRIDNKKGYTLENVVPCCYPCNMVKNTHSKEFFIDRCKKIGQHQAK